MCAALGRGDNRGVCFAPRGRYPGAGQQVALARALPRPAPPGFVSLKNHGGHKVTQRHLGHAWDFQSENTPGSLRVIFLAEAAGAGDRLYAIADRLFSQVHVLREKRGSAEPVPPSTLQGFNIQRINRIMAFYHPTPPAVLLLLMNYYVLHHEQMLDNLRKL